MKKVVRLFFVVTFVVFSTISLLHSPVNAEVIELTDNDYDDFAPQINNAGDIVWSGYDGNDWEVFLYRSASGSSGGGGGSGGCFIDTLSCK